MNSCCFASVIFEGNLPYLKDFLKSLQDQSDTDFTLLLFNDGVKSLDTYLATYNLPYQIIDVSGTIAAVREYMLLYLQSSSFDLVVFGDTDDFFATNRVAISKALLQEYEIITTDVWLVNEAGELLKEGFWSNREELRRDISYETIRFYNVFGLGNTAMQISKLPKKLTIPENLVAVDWYVFSLVLKKKAKAYFTNKTHVFYRQYKGNTIGLKKLTLQRFKSEAVVKLQHYKAMAVIDAEFNSLVSKYEGFLASLDQISEEQLIAHSIQEEHPFWWEQVQL